MMFVCFPFLFLFYHTQYSHQSCCCYYLILVIVLSEVDAMLGSMDSADPNLSTPLPPSLDEIEL